MFKGFVHLLTVVIAQPIFNLLVLIYAVLPGHNFGLAIIIFTIVVRLLLWPLLKKQLHQAKIMRQLQPELKRVKAAAKGDRQKEGQMVMELYKERGINPFGSVGILLLQLPILIGLYSGLRRVILNPHALVSFSYPAMRHLPWIQTLHHNIHRFDGTLFGVVNLTRSALGPKGVYWPAMLIVAASAVMQFYQSKQLMPVGKDARKLRDILKEAGNGNQADQAEMNAAIGRSTRFFLPVMIFLFTVNIASALSLYWLVGGAVAFIQQSMVLREDTTEMEAEVASEAGKKVVKGEVIPPPQTNSGPKRKAHGKKRRRK
ncbi:MAG TPA: YidC/Oxa1 family membrane protein insertase [Candidatus Saccharimonadales bacterium]|nr:YidC/Oxa1 family membrane protein insertase [Candidatus Saccharimonadales bacterium]